MGCMQFPNVLEDQKANNQEQEKIISNKNKDNSKEKESNKEKKNSLIKDEASLIIENDKKESKDLNDLEGEKEKGKNVQIKKQKEDNQKEENTKKDNSTPTHKNRLDPIDIKKIQEKRKEEEQK